MTVEDILKRIGSWVDQSATVPTDDDLDIRLNFVNEAYEEWARSYDWDELRIDFTYGTTAVSCVSVALPSGYLKAQSPLYVHQDGTDYTFSEIKSGDKYDSTDYVFWVSGNRRDGFVAIVPMGLSSGASVRMQFQSMPTSLATTTQIPVMSDANFLVQRGIQKVWMNRGDPRFQNMDSEANRNLSNMIEHQNALRSRSGENRIKDYYTQRGYRIGRR
jgi:hypothetical protein